MAGAGCPRQRREGVIIALETFQNQEADGALPSRGGEECPSSPPQHPVPCTEVDPVGLLVPDHPEPLGAGAGRAEGVRSPRVIANSKEGRGKSWWRRRGKRRLFWGVGLSKLISLKKNRFVEKAPAPPRCPALLASPSCASWQERAGEPAGRSVPRPGAQDPDSLVSDLGDWGGGEQEELQQRKPNTLNKAWGEGRGGKA